MTLSLILNVVLGLCLMVCASLWWSARMGFERLAEELVRRRAEALEADRTIEAVATELATVRAERDDLRRSCDDLFERVLQADQAIQLTAHRMSLIRVQARLGLLPLGGDALPPFAEATAGDEILREIGFGSALPSEDPSPPAPSPFEACAKGRGGSEQAEARAG